MVRHPRANITPHFERTILVESAPDDLHESPSLRFAFGPFCVTPNKRLLTKNDLPLEIGDVRWTC
jgi:hypothetical protein